MFVVGAGVFAAPFVVHANTYSVTTNANAGAGSLRAAVTNANANPGIDTIDFVGVAGMTITLATPLDTITEEVVIDGTTLPETQDGPEITVVGSPDGGSAVFVFNNTDDGNVVKGIAFTAFDYCIYSNATAGLQIGGTGARDGNWFDAGGRCLQLHDDDGTVIQGNVIGGQAGNEFGIDAAGSTNLTIGGTAAGAKNIIVNSDLYGMSLSGVSDVVVQGNWIGTFDGDDDQGNGSHGIFLNDVTDVTIGGTAAGAGNVISGNGFSGISIPEDDDTGIVIQGNYIGVNADGDDALPNTLYGIESASAITVGGTAAGAGNVISGNPGAQISLEDAGATDEVPNVVGSTVQGNVIGLNAAGDAVIDGGVGSGIRILNSNNQIGGTAAGAGNVISGNVQDGIYLIGNVFAAQDNVIQGNIIGLDATGEVDFGNGSHGISMEAGADGTQIGGTVSGAKNIISGNGLRGVFVGDATGAVIEGNFIGLDDDGTTALPNAWSGIELQGDNNTVGGTTADSRNVISGNTSYGVVIGTDSTGNVLTNNYIGTDSTGLASVPNAGGLFFSGTVSGNTVGGAGVGNLISGNTANGIWIFDETVGLTTIQGNYIGVDVTGDAALPNGASGITSLAPSAIGGTGAGEGNVISGNGDIGIVLNGAGGSTVLGNLIGTNADGDAAVPNVVDGIMILSSGNTVGGTTAAARNVISGNGRIGVFLFGIATTEDNVVQGNYIGTNAAGDAAIPNAGHGVLFAGTLATNNTVGGTVAGAGNVISGNAQSGINVEDALGGQTIAGNYIGTNAAGDAAIPNGNMGIRMDSDNNMVGGTTAASRNVISGNSESGIFLFGTSTGNTFQNNYIGTNAAGSAAVGNVGVGFYVVGVSTDNQIGVAGFGNVISGNGGRGLFIDGDDADGNSIQGNRIGLGADGSTIVGNTGAGLVIVHADDTLVGTANASTAKNIVSGNGDHGIWLWGTVTGTVVVDNYAGVASDGTTLAVNTGDAVRVENTASSNTIGGTATGAGNTAAAADNMDCYTVAVDGGDFNAIRGNSCLDEGIDGVLNINREGTSNEDIAAPDVEELTASTSYVEGTSDTFGGEVDLFVNGLYVATTDTDEAGDWFKAAGFASGGMLSAAVTNDNDSTSSTTLQIALFDDVTAPTADSLTPADGASGVSTTTNLVINFSEVVLVGEGNIVIKRTSSDATVETIDVEGVRVTGSGTSTITIDPSVTLGDLLGYYVQIDGTAFVDHSDNPYAGIADETTWNFVTAGTEGITVSEISGDTTEAGGTATFTVVLDTEPTDDVVIGLTSSRTEEGTVLPVSLTFTPENWDDSQTVTVTGQDDSVDDGDVVYAIVTAAAESEDGNYDGLNPDNVSVTNTDDDEFGISVSDISGDTTEAGGTATFTVVLDSEPTDDVVIGVWSSDETEGTVLPVSLTFTSENWDDEQTVTVTGVDDALDDGDVSYFVFFDAAVSEDANYADLIPAGFILSNVDNDEPEEDEEEEEESGSSGGGSSAPKILRVTVPTAGRAVTAGSTLNVRWSSIGQIPYVNLLLSTDSGATWDVIRSRVENEGNVSFVVPLVPTTEAVVRVEGIRSSSTLLTSDESEPFAIVSSLTDVAAHSLVKLPDDGNPTTEADSAVYYIGTDGYRHAFPNAKVYFTWYGSFNDVRVVSAEALAGISLGSNVTYRPGVKMVKFQVVPTVYAVDRYGVLRWVASETVATALYGTDWNTKIDDVSDAFYLNYSIGGGLDDAASFDPTGFSDIATISDNLAP